LSPPQKKKIGGPKLKASECGPNFEKLRNLIANIV